MAVAIVCVLGTGCGPKDYEKPITQFQDASAVVISATGAFLKNMNTIEQNHALDDVIFGRKPLNLPEIAKKELITPADIKLRMDALDALSQYTANLAILAQGKAGEAVGENTKELSESLKTLASDAGNLPAAKGTGLDNAKFSGIAGAAASAVGAVAQLIVDHKARREIEKSVVAQNENISALIQLIRDEAQGAYLRQQAQIGDYGDQLFLSYKQVTGQEDGHKPDPILLLYFGTIAKSYLSQKAEVANANPADAIDKMKKAHDSLVNYVKSDKSPKSLAELVSAVQDFAAAAAPLGQAVQALVSASQQ